MDSRTLRRRIDLAIERLAPLFGVSEAQLMQFPKPRLRRRLKPHEHPDFSRDQQVPGYTPIYNFFYFPFPNQRQGTHYDIFCQATFNHEAGHYFHYQVNPSMIEGIRKCLRTGKRPAGHGILDEMVAEYANIILGRRDYENWEVRNVYGFVKEVYDQQGAGFLPVLARMSLDEAISSRIIVV